jgi:hypothetical protein
MGEHLSVKFNPLIRANKSFFKATMFDLPVSDCKIKVVRGAADQFECQVNNLLRHSARLQPWRHQTISYAVVGLQALPGLVYRSLRAARRLQRLSAGGPNPHVSDAERLDTRPGLFGASSPPPHRQIHTVIHWLLNRPAIEPGAHHLIAISTADC